MIEICSNESEFCSQIATVHLICYHRLITIGANLLLLITKIIVRLYTMDCHGNVLKIAIVVAAGLYYVIIAFSVRTSCTNSGMDYV